MSDGSLGMVWVWLQCLLMPQSLSTLSFIVDKCLYQSWATTATQVPQGPNTVVGYEWIVWVLGCVCTEACVWMVGRMSSCLLGHISPATSSSQVWEEKQPQPWAPSSPREDRGKGV